MPEVDDWQPVAKGVDDWQPVAKGVDDWQPVGAPARETPDSGIDIDRASPFVSSPIEAGYSASVPDAFLDRLRRGQALGRVLDRTLKDAQEGFGDEPIAGSDAHIDHLMRELSIQRYDPTSKASPLQVDMVAAGVAAVKMTPLVRGLMGTVDATMRGINAGLHAVGGGLGQIVEEAGGPGDKARNEIINFGNFAMIEAGMGRFVRPIHYWRAAEREVFGASDQPVGGLPKAEDFTTAAELLRGGAAPAVMFDGKVIKGRPGETHADILERNNIPFDTKYPRLDADLFVLGDGEVVNRNEMSRRGLAETAEDLRDFGLRPTKEQMATPYEQRLGNIESHLRDLWEERGIHPAEAVHDAKTDAFFQSEITRPYIEVYHGSPYDFEAFSIEHVGSGEGAQTYGYGLYFAEHPDVAKSYADKLAQVTATHEEMVTGEPSSTTANLYRVRINADREHFLDWDKPLSEQPENVKAAVEKLFPDGKTSWGYKLKTGEDVVRALAGEMRGDRPIASDPAAASNALLKFGIPGIKYLDHGSRPIAGRIQSARDSISTWEAHLENATDANRAHRQQMLDRAKDDLRQAEADAAAPEKSTSNFAVFDDKLVEITHKNGIALRDMKLEDALDAVQAGKPAEPVNTGAAHVDAVLANPAVKSEIDNAVINRTNDVPYGAGAAAKPGDPTVNIDRHFPREMTIDGVTFDPAQPFTIHELVERHVMEELIKGGMDDQSAYKVAHFEYAEKAEGAWYQSKGIDQATAEAAYRPILDAIQHENPANPPADLYKKPYPHDDVAMARTEPTTEPEPTRAEVERANAILRKSVSLPAGDVTLLARRADELETKAQELARQAYEADAAGNAALRDRLLEERAPLIDEAASTRITLQDHRAVTEPEVAGTPAYEAARLTALGADVTDAMPTLAQQSASPPGRLSAATNAIADKLFDIGRDIQMKVAPMATGTRDTIALAKDFANTLRRNRWDWARKDDDITGRFAPEQRTRMFNAMDEESVAIQKGESREHQGLATLTADERAMVESLDASQQLAFMRARDLGMVEGEGIPMHATRFVMNIANAGDKDGALSLDAIGQNLTVRTPFLRHRKYLTVEETEAAAKTKFGEQAVVARDIRAVALSTARLEDAIAGRTMINNIKEYGKRTGDETVTEGSSPGEGWFTLDHPAFKTWKPRLEEADTATYREAVLRSGGVEVERVMIPARDAAGDIIFDQHSIYVRGDFEGPLRAVLTQKSGATYQAFMGLKAKTMSMIMNSPMIHNAVEWGRALPAMPGKVVTFRVYFEGNRAKKDVALMHEAIDGGLVPIGKRFFNQDITSIMESPDLTPGRSLTSKVLGFVPGLFDPAAEIAVRSAIDKAGDFWHNTLLWDRVGDLQMGLYTNMRDDMIAKGSDRLTASRVAAHWANRYAGALPQEAMSDSARKISNVLMFSRSFTLGNLGAMKDMLTGLPKDVLAQIERDAGFKVGAINESASAEAAGKAVSYAKTMARRKAMSIVGLDIALMYVGNSLLQSGLNVMVGDRTLGEELHSYAQRFVEKMQSIREHPLELLQPFGLFQSMSATAENEPGRENRIHVGQTEDGTAIYARNPAGKIGEEFEGYLTGPLDMIRRKLGTIARPGWQILSNDQGFGRKVYDPNADTPAKYVGVLAAVIGHLVKSQFPEGQFNAASDLIKGEGDAKLNALQAFGPLAGITFSKGAPGGPAVGELYHAREQHNFEVNAALPEIRKQFQRGEIAEARQRLNELGVPPGLARFYENTSVNPATARLRGRTLTDFYKYATPEQRERLDRARTR